MCTSCCATNGLSVETDDVFYSLDVMAALKGDGRHVEMFRGVCLWNVCDISSVHVPKLRYSERCNLVPLIYVVF